MKIYEGYEGLLGLGGFMMVYNGLEVYEGCWVFYED